MKIDKERFGSVGRARTWVLSPLGHKKQLKDDSMWDARDTKEYWEARVRPYLETADPLASVTSTGLPNFFARYTDWLERRTLRQALMYLRNKGPFLEVGCGY